MIKSINKSLRHDEVLEKRLAEELEDRMELDCWVNFCLGDGSNS